MNNQENTESKIIVTIVTDKGVFTFYNPMVINVKKDYEQIVHIVEGEKTGTKESKALF